MALPPLRAEEAVASLRGALGEIVGFAPLTQFRFVLEKLKLNDGGEMVKNHPSALDTTTTANVNVNVVSPYMLKGCVVSVPPSVKTLQADYKDDDCEDNEMTLDEYGDLSCLVGVLDEQSSDEDSKLVLDANGAKNRYAVRVVLERYDASAVREQIGRVRALLAGNAPALTSLAVDDADVNVGANTADHVDGEAVAETKAEAPSTTDATPPELTPEQAATKAKQDAAQAREEMAKQLPHFPPSYDLSLSAAVQGDCTGFYHLACGEEFSIEGTVLNDGSKDRKSKALDDWMEAQGPEVDSKKKRRNQKKKKSSNGNGNSASPGNQSNNDNNNHTKSTPSFSVAETEQILHALNSQTIIEATIRLSGYHPPPPHRRILGDLAYIECLLPNQPPIHVTAFSLGFYVNNTSSSSFDPTPAPSPCYSHTLLDCLLQSSPTLHQSYSKALTASQKRVQILKHAANSEDAFMQLYRPASSTYWNNHSGTSLGSGLSLLAPSTFVPRLDGITLRPSWLVPLPTIGKTKLRTYKHHGEMHQWDVSRCQDEMTSVYGMDVRGGGIRDWNEELQSARDMGVETLDERMERARLVVEMFVIENIVYVLS